MATLKKWTMRVGLVGTIMLTTAGCSLPMDLLSKNHSDQSVTAQQNENQGDSVNGPSGSDKSAPSKGNTSDSEVSDKPASNGGGTSDKQPKQTKFPDRPWLKETIKVTADGKHIVTNTSSILVCADKHRNLGNYVPKHLVVPDIKFPYANPEKYEKAHLRKVAATAIEKLFHAAKQDGIQLYGQSGYRSYQRQVTVFASNVKQYGSEEKANQVSAEPGQSEHQTGLSMDVTSADVGYTLTQKFGKTKAGKWIAANGWKYGFIIRYPKGKEDITGYEYEPWHIRYVGKKAAKVIHQKQNTLEQYLSK